MGVVNNLELKTPEVRYDSLNKFDVFEHGGDTYMKIYHVDGYFLDLDLHTGAVEPCYDDCDFVTLIKQNATLTVT